MATWTIGDGVTLAVPSPAKPAAVPTRDTSAEKYLDTYEESLQDVDELNKACREGDFDQLKLILEEVKAKGRSCEPLLNLKHKVKTTPLHEACGCGSVDCISLLLENGAEANVFDSLGFAPIHSAAYNNNHQAIKTLLDHQPRNPNFTSRCSVDQPTDSGETPLQLACRLGHVETAEFLLGFGASVEGVDQRKNCLLHCVSASDSTVLWSWALNALEPHLTSMLNQGNQDGETPAHVAASGGCSISVSALRELNADFGIKDRRDISAMDTMHVHGNTLCFAIATGQHPVKVIPPSPIPARALSSNSTASPKIRRRSSMTGRNRPLTVPIPPPSASSSYQDLRNSTRRDSMRSVHSRTSSMDSYLSKESLIRVSSHLSRLSSVSSDERVQVVLDTATYNPPQDLTVVEPIYRESITPKQSSIYCKEHGIKFSTRYFIKDTSKSNKEAAIKPKEASVEADEEIPVCIAAAMHLNISYSPNYIIISPVCFVSCRCEKAFRATLELPHAADLTEDNQEDKKHMCILHYIITNLSSSGLKSPSPMVRVLDRLNVESLEIENRCVRFKTSFKSPSLYAVGARSSGTTVPRPFVKLRCALFCMFQKFEKREVISIVTVRMFVGLSLQTVTQVIREEAKSSNSNFEDVLFTMRGGGIELQSTLNNTDGHWTMESNKLHKLTYNQIALTEESTKYFTYSHDLTYPPYKPVRVLPRDHQHTNLSFPVLFKATVRDVDSHQEIADVDFVPFAPLKSTTATPNPSPPYSHGNHRFAIPDRNSSPARPPSWQRMTTPPPTTTTPTKTPIRRVYTPPAKPLAPASTAVSTATSSVPPLSGTATPTLTSATPPSSGTITPLAYSPDSATPPAGNHATPTMAASSSTPPLSSRSVTPSSRRIMTTLTPPHQSHSPPPPDPTHHPRATPPGDDSAHSPPMATGQSSSLSSNHTSRSNSTKQNGTRSTLV